MSLSIEKFQMALSHTPGIVLMEEEFGEVWTLGILYSELMAI